MELLDSGAPFTAAMATSAGISARALKRLSASGQIRQILHGVYVAVGVRDTIDLRARAARLVLPDHCVVCDVCAAWLHGIDLLDFAELDVVPDLDVVAVAGHQAPERKGVFGGKRTLQADDIMVIDGLRVTTPIRTACDVARLRGRLRAIACLDAFRKEYGITIEELRAMLPRYVAQRGVIQLRELIPLSTDRADSQPESWVRLIIHDEQLPMPEPQVWTLLPDLGWVRTENAYAHLRIAVEYDGEEHHTSEEDREHDRKRRRALRAAGWIIIVIRKDDLGERARSWWLRELAAALQERAPQLKTKRIYSRGPDEPSYHRRPQRRR
ncbi:type IV toxin-antitoxin system AbiEi family antitoxin domain-containing protein [Nocardioides albidus]|uniref:Type IV toxin-antitoxin system AbiEi family antitoxin domain-containing protein n=1 Tax=Nocardioides albidus TaxID=1517589 RepID=A0A5C4WDE1_9ACTN|nr:type IV toxin-antitoxin system AbiEi family antitoxin domain-containing protein [Nocardioides albidus]TNM46083.1 type IV toxin-antitoxin system AbiEi family antitoxin domain-containing protein [Nocardioides albidus]